MIPLRIGGVNASCIGTALFPHRWVGLKDSQQCNNVPEPILNRYYFDWIRVDGISFAGMEMGALPMCKLLKNSVFSAVRRPASRY